MKMIQVTPSVRNEASGTRQAVMGLCHALIQQGHDLTLTVNEVPSCIAPSGFIKSFPLGMGPRRLGRSPRMKAWLFQEVQKNQIEVLHNHGMWHMSAIYSAWAANAGKVKLIQSPHGTFSQWAMDWGSKFKPIFWKLLQFPALQNSVCFHVTSEAEYLDVRRMGFTQPVAIIPNGVDLPQLKLKKRNGPKTLLFLGRIHSIKGLDLLLLAWKELQHNYPEWCLRIVGTDDGFLKQCNKMVKELCLVRVEFPGPLYGEAKLQAYTDADIFILPSHTENFAIAVAESLSLGTPAIVSKGAPWSGLIDNNAGWWVDIGVDPLISCLKEAFTHSRLELEDMGCNGRKWMERDFSWKAASEQMSATYEWLCNPLLPRPACVRME